MRCSRYLSVGMLSTVAASLLVAAPMFATPAAAAETYYVPSSGVWRLEGHGFGHGHGLNQWGAEGAARTGHSYTGILNVYYPHTVPLRVPNRNIRVWIQQDSDNDVIVNAGNGLLIRDLQSGQSAGLPAGPIRWRITVRECPAPVLPQAG